MKMDLILISHYCNTRLHILANQKGEEAEVDIKSIQRNLGTLKVLADVLKQMVEASNNSFQPQIFNTTDRRYLAKNITDCVEIIENN
mmetsp:Transcript_10633/g.17869  ORF Transcript_10633/g.17869 Transcript_10633/m.17869 type:complete len:87 (+) Transcript_10633:253-513(+)